MPAGVGANRPFTPPAISVSDNVAWAAGSSTITIDWGDGATTSLPFAGAPVPTISVPVTLPPHVYVLPGQFAISVTIADPAANSATQPITTADILPPLTPAEGFPRLVGTPKVGRTLACKPGRWGDESAEIAFRWKVGGSRIPGLTDERFRVRRRDQGRRLTCEVIERNDAFVARATSNALRIRATRRR